MDFGRVTEGVAAVRRLRVAVAPLPEEEEENGHECRLPDTKRRKKPHQNAPRGDKTILSAWSGGRRKGKSFFITPNISQVRSGSGCVNIHARGVKTFRMEELERQPTQLALVRGSKGRGHLSLG